MMITAKHTLDRPECCDCTVQVLGNASDDEAAILLLICPSTGERAKMEQTPDTLVAHSLADRVLV